MTGNLFQGIDCETFKIEPGNIAPRLVCMTTYNPYNGAFLYSVQEAKLAFYRMITDSCITLVGHNVAYDLLVLAKTWGYIDEVFEAYEARRIRDTGIRQRLMDIASGRTKDGMVYRGGKWSKAAYSLFDLECKYIKYTPEQQAEREASKKDPKAWRLRYSELVDVPTKDWPIDARQYAVGDAINAHSIFHHQAGTGNLDIPDEHEQTYAAWALHLISSRGITVSKEKSEKLAAVMAVAQEANRRRLLQVGFLRPTRLTPAMVRKGKAADAVVDGKPVVYAKNMAKIKAHVVKRYQRIGQPLSLTAKGGVPTDKDTMIESRSPLLALLSEEGGVDKIITTYLPILRSGYEHPICAGYEPIVNSGRCSSYRPNLQNIPSGRRVGGVRESFVPSDGYWFCAVDFDTFELRTLAQCCLWMFGESKMAEALNAGMDLHIVVAAQLLGITYDEALKRYEEGDEEEVKKARGVAKAANFGFPGGMGISKFVLAARKSYGVRVSEAAAREVKAAWQQAWPEMRLYHNEINLRVGEPMLQLGTQRVRGGCNFTEGANTLFQGLAGSAAKAACVAVVREAYTSGGSLQGVKPVAFVHDEILSEVDIDCAHELAYGLTQVMTTAAQKLVPDVKITAKPVLMSCWSKKAKQTFDAEGNLTCWHPEEKA